MSKSKKKTNKNNKLPAIKKKMGRPSKYMPDLFPNMAKELVSMWGVNDKKLAKLFKVTESTITDWKNKHKDFSTSLKEGKEDFDSLVMEDTCLRRAMGYDYTETTVSDTPKGRTVTTMTKHMPPDPTSFIFWLKNRNPDRWGDVWRKNLNDDNKPPQGNTYINILGELSIEQLERIRGIVGGEVPAIVKDTNT